MPVPLSEIVTKRWNQVLEDLSLPLYEKKYLEPFTVFGFNLFRAGSVNSRWGAIIGIPINFTYRSTKTVDPSPIQVNNEPVNWNRQDAKDLLDALVLSEDAQRYGMAREILMAKNDGPLVRSSLAAFMVSSVYLIGRGMNDKLNLLPQPRSVRIFFYSIATAFSYAVWAVQKDIINVYWEKEADSAIAQLGDRYKRGAVEFYEKEIKKNLALRTLLGADGEGAYTPAGNEKFLFRQPTIPLDQRKQFFVDLLNPVKTPVETGSGQPAVAAPA